MEQKKAIKDIEISCPHIKKTKGSVYIYELKGLYFMFCEKCNKELLKQMIKQKELEDSI
jgi:hypothetical protein